MANSSATRYDLCSCSARELAQLIATGEATAQETVRAHIARIEQINLKLNAVVVKQYERAMHLAELADEQKAIGAPLGPLHGVPITIKESLDLAQTPSTFGVRRAKDSLASTDDIYVSRLTDAGAIVLGKTNVAQALMFSESENPIYGRSNNPWNINRTPGGSSGGEAAIIAAGGSPLGLGTDFGGSLRVPATFCGIASIKPTAGRAPDCGRFSIPLGQQAIVSQVGPMARTVDDIALGLALVTNDNKGVSAPLQPLGDYRTVDMNELRIAYFTDDGVFPASPACQRAVIEAADLLNTAGAKVHTWTPPDLLDIERLFLRILFADGLQWLKTLLVGQKPCPQLDEILFLAHRSKFSIYAISIILGVLGEHSLSKKIKNVSYRDTSNYWKTVEQLLDCRNHFMNALDDAVGGPIDIILCPAFALPALKHRSVGTIGGGGTYACLANVLGYPAGVVPVTKVCKGEEVGSSPSLGSFAKAVDAIQRGSAGLPVGVQIIARPWKEHHALAVMKKIETEARKQGTFPHTPTVLL
jgi:fatty acid amide hydrolase